MTERNDKSREVQNRSGDANHRVGDIMALPEDVLHPDHELLEAESRLERTGLSVLPVVDGDEVVGILTGQAVQTWRDAAVAPEADATVTDYMSASVPICRADETLDSVAKVMEREARPGLLVVDAQDQLLGVVTREMLEEKGYAFAGAEARRGAPTTPHTVKSAARARGERHGWLKSYSVRPQVRR